MMVRLPTGVWVSTEVVGRIVVGASGADLDAARGRIAICPDHTPDQIALLLNAAILDPNLVFTAQLHDRINELEQKNVELQLDLANLQSRHQKISDEHTLQLTELRVLNDESPVKNTGARRRFLGLLPGKIK